jgi:hypothetical protein
MRITLSNIKTLLDIANTTYDTKIALLLPQIIKNIVNYCKNPFLRRTVESIHSLIATFEDTGNTITLSDNLDFPLSTDDFIYIRLSDYNDGIYQVTSYTNQVITIKSNYTLRNESDSAITIYLCEIPDDILMLVCKILKKNFTIENTSGIKREEMPDYEIEYKDSGSTYFDETDLKLLTNYRKVYWKWE